MSESQMPTDPSTSDSRGHSAAPDHSAQPLRIVFSLLHLGYLRHYAEPIRVLAASGHAVHLALYRDDEKDRGDARLLARLLEDCPSVTVGRAPRRLRADGWRALGWMTRGSMDVLRYVEPRYATADALRQRAIETVRLRIGTSSGDPLSRWLISRFLNWAGRLADPPLARRLIRILMRIEEAIPASRQVDDLLKRYGADVVLASPVVEIASPQVEVIKSARRLGIPSAICVASWDNLTNKGLLRVLPDRVLVWNEIQRRELLEMHGVPDDRIVITGGQKFDPWFELSPVTTREDFAVGAGLDPTEPYVLYLCSSPFVAPDEVSFVRRWVTALRATPELAQLGVLVRPHPQNAAQWTTADLSDLEGVAVWPREGEYPDEGEARQAFFESIAHCLAVVGINTSAQIEAAIVGRPVYTVRDSAFALTQEGTIHFHYLLRENGGFVRSSSSIEEHIKQLVGDLRDQRETRAELDRFVASFVRPCGVDRPAVPIVAAEIEALAAVPPNPLPATSTVLIRAALYPFAALVYLAAAPAVVRKVVAQRFRPRSALPARADD